MLYYTNTLNLIKLNLKHNRNIVKIKKTKKVTKLLNFLCKINLLQGYCQKETYYYFVYLNKFFNKNLNIFVKPSAKLVIKKKNINSLTNTNKYKYIYLSTNFGLMSLFEAKNKAIGGILLFSIV